MVSPVPVKVPIDVIRSVDDVPVSLERRSVTAGAVIGAVTSRDKFKGGLIGAAAGGILGAVIGNNVDVKRTPF